MVEACIPRCSQVFFLGCARRVHGGHRANRGDSRPGSDSLGRERRQRLSSTSSAKARRKLRGLWSQAVGATEEQGFGGVRYGGQLSSNVFFRVYGKYFNRDEFRTPKWR